ncbi:phosphomannomutase [Photobacterium sp. BZF1]|uniref:phosphomannomutase n=1 Tax=Photobacterium sp. BZF1 TaxID=1904457 RepID=UPI001CA4481E|nr:phosphomannomutase [Photobacterium sp. BZF1]
MEFNSDEIISTSGIKFGTSGARGLVSDFNIPTCAAFTHAFVACMKRQFLFKRVAIAIDNRPSSPSMAQACAKAVLQAGLEVVYYGVVPTPALAFAAMDDAIPAIMVTGSHIPFDRNGLKFYRPDGEITKADEEAILNTNVNFSPIADLPILPINPSASAAYVDRYTSLFDHHFLTGKRIGIYEHSSAGRDLYSTIFSLLGAEVIPLGRSNQFVPIDTEAVSEDDQDKAKQWSSQYHLDLIFSTDGDGDRPLVSDEKGNWIRGDILGLLCANEMQIEALAVPVSCNTAIESSKHFKHVARTKIGSPYVIEAITHLANNYHSVAGFEANGGFLLGSNIEINSHLLKALPTRDAVLPALMVLAASQEVKISELINTLPSRSTHSDRLQNFATIKSTEIIERAKEHPEPFLSKLGFKDAQITNIDVTDGLRLTLVSGDIIHLRPSGNAPELRCYAESESSRIANQLVTHTLNGLRSM